MLRSDKPDAMEDAFNVMKAFNVKCTADLYLFRLRTLVQESKVRDAKMARLQITMHSLPSWCFWTDWRTKIAALSLWHH